MTLLRASLLGGIDGCITSFAVVAGVHAGGLSRGALWVVGVSSVFADGLSMGVSEFLSSVTETKSTVQSARLGLACFALFVVCGMVPLVVYAAAGGGLLACSAFSLVQLMLLGVARAQCSAGGGSRLAALVQTAGLGGVAGAVAYAVAAVVHRAAE
jgi:hypothetical protein